ncbi:hypothetical protein Bhyg_10399, partial [Pseudolycoriella hygida]
VKYKILFCVNYFDVNIDTWVPMECEHNIGTQLNEVKWCYKFWTKFFTSKKKKILTFNS